jgi:hypothetical protein
MQQMGSHAEAAAAARALNRRDPTGGEHRMVGAEQKLFHATVEIRVTSDADVGFRCLTVDYLLLGPLDTLQHRRIAGLVLVDADTEIDFVGRLILTKQRHDADDRVRREQL